MIGDRDDLIHLVEMLDQILEHVESVSLPSVKTVRRRADLANRFHDLRSRADRQIGFILGYLSTTLGAEGAQFGGVLESNSESIIQDLWTIVTAAEDTRAPQGRKRLSEDLDLKAAQMAHELHRSGEAKSLSEGIRKARALCEPEHGPIPGNSDEAIAFRIRALVKRHQDRFEEMRSGILKSPARND